MTENKRPTAAQMAERVAELESRVAVLEQALIRRDPRVPGRPSVKQK